MPNQTPSTSEFNSKILGHNIKEGRKRMNNMPQKELADLAGISRHTLIDIESGKRDTSLRTVAEIAKHLQTTLSQLLASQSEVTHGKGHNGEEKSLNTNGHIDEPAIVEVHLEYLRGADPPLVFAYPWAGIGRFPTDVLRRCLAPVWLGQTRPALRHAFC